jgi:hypothetical protein
VTCSDPQWCLGDHIRPRLDGWVKSGSKPGQYSARCPAHDDQRASLSVGIGERGILWHCHRGCSDADVRAALVRRGVPDGCLRRVAGQRAEDELVSALTAILESERSGPARDLRMAAVVWNRGKIPRGAELEALAARARLSRSTAYRATLTGPTSGTKRDGNATETKSQSETKSPNLRLSVTGLTSGFGRSVVPGVDNSVDGRPPARSPLAPLSVAPGSVASRCQWCERELEPGRTARARFCCASCRQKAARRRTTSSSSTSRSPPARVPESADDTEREEPR